MCKLKCVTYTAKRCRHKLLTRISCDSSHYSFDSQSPLCSLEYVTVVSSTFVDSLCDVCQFMVAHSLQYPRLSAGQSKTKTASNHWLGGFGDRKVYDDYVSGLDIEVRVMGQEQSTLRKSLRSIHRQRSLLSDEMDEGHAEDNLEAEASPAEEEDNEIAEDDKMDVDAAEEPRTWRIATDDRQMAADPTDRASTLELATDNEINNANRSLSPKRKRSPTTEMTLASNLSKSNTETTETADDKEEQEDDGDSDHHKKRARKEIVDDKAQGRNLANVNWKDDFGLDTNVSVLEDMKDLQDLENFNKRLEEKDEEDKFQREKARREKARREKAIAEAKAIRKKKGKWRAGEAPPEDMDIEIEKELRIEEEAEEELEQTKIGCLNGSLLYSDEPTRDTPEVSNSGYEAVVSSRPKRKTSERREQRHHILRARSGLGVERELEPIDASKERARGSSISQERSQSHTTAQAIAETNNGLPSPESDDHRSYSDDDDTAQEIPSVADVMDTLQGNMEQRSLLGEAATVGTVIKSIEHAGGDAAPHIDPVTREQLERFQRDFQAEGDMEQLQNAAGPSGSRNPGPSNDLRESFKQDTPAKQKLKLRRLPKPSVKSSGDQSKASSTEGTSGVDSVDSSKLGTWIFDTGGILYKEITTNDGYTQLIGDGFIYTVKRKLGPNRWEIYNSPYEDGWSEDTNDSGSESSDDPLDNKEIATAYSNRNAGGSSSGTTGQITTEVSPALSEAEARQETQEQCDIQELVDSGSHFRCVIHADELNRIHRVKLDYKLFTSLDGSHFMVALPISEKNKPYTVASKISSSRSLPTPTKECTPHLDPSVLAYSKQPTIERVVSAIELEEMEEQKRNYVIVDILNTGDYLIAEEIPFKTSISQDVEPQQDSNELSSNPESTTSSPPRPDVKGKGKPVELRETSTNPEAAFLPPSWAHVEKEGKVARVGRVCRQIKDTFNGFSSDGTRELMPPPPSSPRPPPLSYTPPRPGTPSRFLTFGEDRPPSRRGPILGFDEELESEHVEDIESETGDETRLGPPPFNKCVSYGDGVSPSSSSRPRSMSFEMKKRFVPKAYKGSALPGILMKMSLGLAQDKLERAQEIEEHRESSESEGEHDVVAPFPAREFADDDEYKGQWRTFRIEHFHWWKERQALQNSTMMPSLDGIGAAEVREAREKREIQAIIRDEMRAMERFRIQKATDRIQLLKDRQEEAVRNGQPHRGVGVLSIQEPGHRRNRPITPSRLSTEVRPDDIPDEEISEAEAEKEEETEEKPEETSPKAWTLRRKPSDSEMGGM